MQNTFVTPNTELRRKYLPSSSTRKDQTYLDYMELLKSYGIQINSKCFPSFFALKNGLEYPGVATTEKISSNEVLVRVPKKLVLSSFKALQCPELKEVYKERFYHEDWAWEDRVLNTYLLHIYGQRQTSNIWYHMVEHLSKDIDIIGFWPEEDLDKFKDLTVKSAAEADNESFEQEWADFLKLKEKHQVLQHEVFSKQNYRWIFIHLISRCFGKQLEFTSMVPFCQFFNHHAVDGHYDVQILPQKQTQDDETSSITTEGSYLSQEYVEVGEYAYDEIQCQPFTWQCKQHLDLNQKQKSAILSLSSKILENLQNDLNWEDVSILFVPHLVERCKLTETEYKAGRKIYAKALEELTVIQDGITLYKKNISQGYNKWRGRGYAYKTDAERKKQEEQKKAKQLAENNITEEGIIDHPKEEKKSYDNFLLLTGKRDIYQPNNQVYFCYGRNSNRTLLLRYGFAIEGNKYEHVWLSFDIMNSLIHFPDTVQKLEEKHLSLRRKFKLKINRLNLELILFFRLNSWSYFGKNSIEELFKIKDYGREIAILVQLLDSIEFRHQQFEGTYDLTDPKLSYHEYFVNVYHQQKQKILSQHIGFLKSLIKFSKNLEKGADLQKEKEQFTAQQKFIFRHYLAQFE